MKKNIFYFSIFFTTTMQLNGATIRIYNKTKNPIDVTTQTKNPITHTIPSMRSQFVNSWFNTINGFEWQSNGTKWEVPLHMSALQTEGRLYIKNDGQYIFKPCLPCKQSRGTAKPIEKYAQPKSSNKQIKKRNQAKKMRQQTQELEAENMAAEESFGS